MCGICGYIGLNDKILLGNMCNALCHRGPDDYGIYLSDNVGLGHRRLSIIDLVTGKQPIHNENEDIWIVFNGEIYNYIKLRENLEREHQFYTNSDTEVIVHLYEEYGEKCVEKLRGMFSFAIWDENKKKLLLVRDRLGIKPLYYLPMDNMLFFASELKSILQYDEYVPKVNVRSLHDYLSYLYIPAPKTIFTKIKKLLPGYILCYMNGHIQLKQYWDLEFTDSLTKPESYYVKLTKKKIEDAVRLRLISDVPLGAFLSGGLDSSAVVGIMSEIVDLPVKTFSIGFEEQSFSELDYARLVSEYFGTDHRESIVKSDSFTLLPKIIKQFDEPFGNPTSILNYLLSEYTRKYVKVALAGTGGDEVFAGYHRYQAMQFAEYYTKIPFFIRKAILKCFSKIPESTNNNFIKWANMFLKSAMSQPLHGYYSLISYFNESEKSKLFSENFVNSTRSMDSSDIIKQYFDKVSTNSTLNKVFYTEYKTYLLNNILEYTDKTSMAASLEVRVPFLDHELVEFSTTIPCNLKLKRFSKKYILKKAMADLLPKRIITRKKVGFNPPTGLWIQRDLKDLVSQYLSSDEIKKNGYFNYDYIHKMLKLHYNGTRNYESQIIGLICFQIWYDQYID